MTCSRCSNKLTLRRLSSGFPWSLLNRFTVPVAFVFLLTITPRLSTSFAHASSGLLLLVMMVLMGARLFWIRGWLCDSCAQPKAVT